MNIVIYEDRTGIAWPESHAQGLIPFCQENLKLKIARRLSLWRRALPGGSIPLFIVVHDLEVRISRDSDLLNCSDVTLIGTPWMMEALELPGLGMPQDAISLTPECDALPERSRPVFEIVKQDAAWQTAFEERSLAGGLYWNWMNVRICAAYIAPGFPDALRRITRGTSLVKCDFELDGDCEVDADQLLEEGKSWDIDEWSLVWDGRRRARTFDSELPLPSWLEIRQEDLLPSDDENSA